MDKDRAIITQVAAKIAADLTNKEADTTTKLGEFATLFSSVKDVIFEVVYGSSTDTVLAPVVRIQPGSTELSDTQIEASFNATSSEVANPLPATDGVLRVVGDQHGVLPSWLFTACKRDGVTKVYDNRPGLKDNAKRPWFKAVDQENKAYWPPKVKSF